MEGVCLCLCVCVCALAHKTDNYSGLFDHLYRKKERKDRSLLALYNNHNLTKMNTKKRSLTNVLRQGKRKERREKRKKRRERKEKER